MYNRILAKHIVKKLNKRRALVLIGPRRVGKTTLLHDLAKKHYGSYLFLDGDDYMTREILPKAGSSQLKSIIGKNKLVFIDEAQRIENIGIAAKIIVDQFPKTQLIVSGSSALEINDSISEPLTGRKWLYHLYPISFCEFETKIGYLKSTQQLKECLLFGMYPDVLNNRGEEKETLRELCNSYLYKDVLALGVIKKPDILEKLLRALAFQIGGMVSYNELSSLVGVDKNTVVSYIDLLEKAFVIFSLPCFAKNLRNEIKKSKKIYFYDNGVRNAVINDFSPFDHRQDKGALWENFLISERKKFLEYQGLGHNSYFWRTTAQQEVDYVEEYDGKIFGYEFKWKNNKSKINFCKTFSEKYRAKTELIDSENFRKFVGIF